MLRSAVKCRIIWRRHTLLRMRLFFLSRGCILPPLCRGQGWKNMTIEELSKNIKNWKKSSKCRFNIEILFYLPSPQVMLPKLTIPRRYQGAESLCPFVCVFAAFFWNEYDTLTFSDLWDSDIKFQEGKILYKLFHVGFMFSPERKVHLHCRLGRSSSPVPPQRTPVTNIW